MHIVGIALSRWGKIARSLMSAGSLSMRVYHAATMSGQSILMPMVLLTLPGVARVVTGIFNSIMEGILSQPIQLARSRLAPISLSGLRIGMEMLFPILSTHLARSMPTQNGWWFKTILAGLLLRLPTRWLWQEMLEVTVIMTPLRTMPVYLLTLMGMVKPTNC